MSAGAKHRDLDALQLRQDISRQELDDLDARVTQYFQELGENATPAPPPDPSKFDPTREAYWELAMFIAYTMGASLDQVRQVWTRYRREAQQPAGVKLLDLAIYCAMWEKLDGAELLLREEATQIIWKRAEHGELTGYGEPLDGAGKPEAIPLFHWPSLSLDDDNTGLLLRFRSGAGYRNVMFPNPCPAHKITSEPSIPTSSFPARKARKRGPKGGTTERVRKQMLGDLKQGILTAQQLNEEKEIVLSTNYGASRSTIRNARDAALEEWNCASKTNADK